MNNDTKKQWHDVIEYKSPKDGLTIDDYVKTVGYACIYKSLADTVDEIPIEDITVTLVRDTYPREMIKKLISLGNEVDEMAPGIYYVTGNTMFTTQIVVTSRVRMEHTWLRVLTDKIQERDAINFALKGNNVTTQGERNNVDAIYQISVMANIEFYEELKRRDELMCEALKMLMKPEIDESWQNGLEQGISQGKKARQAEVDALTAKIQDKDATLDRITKEFEEYKRTHQ